MIKSKIESIFKPGDILISVGLDWNEGVQQKFYDLRVDEGVKIIACCYDLIPILYPQYCVGAVAQQFSSYFIDVAEGAELVLCISKQTEHDLRKFIESTGARNVSTCYFPLGDNIPTISSDIGVEVQNVMQRDFILFVSSIERRKNHEVLYQAYHLLAKAGQLDVMPTLVFVGMPGWGVSDLLADIRLDPLVQGKIVQLNHVTDSELGALYKNTKFCVYPSFYEGWGLPVGEALSAGKVVLASNEGSLPEVGGDLVHYVDPFSPRDWASALYIYSTNPELLKKQENEILKNYKPRTWRDSCSLVEKKINEFL